MNSAKTGAVRLGGLMLVGGLVTGGLLAMTTPTHMKRDPENWRKAIGVREIMPDEATIPVYAPPEDLTPVHWQSASEENPYAPAPGQWVDTTSDLMPDAADDTDPQLAAEPLPEEIMNARGSRYDAAPDDAAAASAEAAQAAAADVHSSESDVSPGHTAPAALAAT